MHRSVARRRLLGAAAALGGAALVAPVGGTAQAAASDGRTRPDRFPLPNGFRPEGVAIGASPYAYVGSLASGGVYRAHLATGRGSVISAGLGPEPPTVGLKINAYGRLYLSGGASRELRTVDARTGAIEKIHTVGSDGTFVNDVVLRPGAAWFTDSYKALALPARPRAAR